MPATGLYHLRLATAAQIADVSVSTLKRRIAEGKLLAFQDGGLVKIRRTDLEAYLDSLPMHAATAAALKPRSRPRKAAVAGDWV